MFKKIFVLFIVCIVNNPVYTQSLESSVILYGPKGSGCDLQFGMTGAPLVGVSGWGLSSWINSTFTLSDNVSFEASMKYSGSQLEGEQYFVSSRRVVNFGWSYRFNQDSYNTVLRVQFLNVFDGYTKHVDFYEIQDHSSLRRLRIILTMDF